MCELARVLVADTHQAIPVEGREAGALPDRHVQRSDVRVADKRLRVGGDEIEVEVGDHLARASPGSRGSPTTRRRARPPSACRTSWRTRRRRSYRHPEAVSCAAFYTGQGLRD